MYENRRAAYLQLIQKLLESSKGEELQILNAHSDLLDPGLLQILILIAQQFDESGNQDIANFLTNLALRLGEILGSNQQQRKVRKVTAAILFGVAESRYDKLIMRSRTQRMISLILIRNWNICKF